MGIVGSMGEKYKGMNHKLIFITAIIFSLSACRTMERLEGNYDTSPRRCYYTTDSLFYNVKKALEEEGAKITDEDAVSITAELHNTKWAWERKGYADNDKAYVVIKKYYDIGANKLWRPLDVISTWKISISQEKNIYFIKLVDVVANYRSVHYVSEHHAGVTLGGFEKIIAGKIK